MKTTLFTFIVFLIPACAMTSVGGSRYTDATGRDEMQATCQASCVDRAGNGDCIKFSEDMARECARYLRAAGR